MGAFCMPPLKRPQDAAGGLEARRAVTPCHAPTTLHTRPLGASEAPQRPPPYNRASLNNVAREGRSRRRARPWLWPRLAAAGLATIARRRAPPPSAPSRPRIRVPQNAVPVLHNSRGHNAAPAS